MADAEEGGMHDDERLLKRWTDESYGGIQRGGWIGEGELAECGLSGAVRFDRKRNLKLVTDGFILLCGHFISY